MQPTSPSSFNPLPKARVGHSTPATSNPAWKNPAEAWEAPLASEIPRRRIPRPSSMDSFLIESETSARDANKKKKEQTPKSARRGRRRKTAKKPLGTANLETSPRRRVTGYGPRGRFFFRPKSVDDLSVRSSSRSSSRVQARRRVQSVDVSSGYYVGSDDEGDEGGRTKKSWWNFKMPFSTSKSGRRRDSEMVEETTSSVGGDSSRSMVIEEEIVGPRKGDNMVSREENAGRRRHRWRNTARNQWWNNIDLPFLGKRRRGVVTDTDSEVSSSSSYISSEVI
jgi:hypothetical protein